MKNKVLSKILFSILIALAAACARPKLNNYELMRQIADETDTSKRPIYITSTLPIDSADPKKVIYEIDRLDWDEYPNKIKIYSRVYDSVGHFITNMADPYKKDKNATYFTTVIEKLGKEYNPRYEKVKDFHVREFGANDSIPYNIVLTTDYSGSMASVMDAIFEGTELFISLKFPQDAIAVCSFNSKPSVKVPFLRNQNDLLKLYRAKRKEGIGLFSAVYDAAEAGIEMLYETSKTDPRVLVVLSDGDDNYSKIEIGPLIRKAKENKVYVFTVAFGYSDDENLRDLAKYTGGKFYKAYSKEQLVSIFRDIYMSLRFHYLITYKPPVFWGYHLAKSALYIPGRADTLQASPKQLEPYNKLTTKTKDGKDSLSILKISGGDSSKVKKDSLLKKTIPILSDSLFAESEYDTSPFTPASLDAPFSLPILFDFDSAVVKVESFPVLDQITDVLMSKPSIRLQIEGHTDNKGSIEYNQKLSERRALAVMNALIQRGIDPHRMRARGFGMSQPIDDNTTDAGRAKNRRTQFRKIAK
ncbi:MAG: OmpA family protein [Candidatus Kapabacteria bacterium]|nr:OmpA family protein [Candidatus Kapabacteria bacterium]